MQSAHQSGRNVLVRADYAPGQSMPPANNDAARTTYVNFLQSVCQDSRYNQHAWGYIIGNETNTNAENQQGPAVTPTWYARVYNGAGAPASDTGNAYSTIKTFQPGAHLLVGAVGPYNSDQGSDDGSHSPIVSMPWLDYFYELCNKAYTSSGAKGVDGFAIHAYGRTGATGGANGGANEPHNDVQGSGWAMGAWAGFTVYKNWRDIINRFDQSTPIWITETNTNTDAHSSQSYPSGWYLQALAEIKAAGPRFWAVCWFPDTNYGGNWPNDCLEPAQGNCQQVNNDFNSAITGTTY